MSDLEELKMLVELHQRDHPDHGTDCACMDKYIQQVRKMTISKEAQRRIDYILRKAIDNR